MKASKSGFESTTRRVRQARPRESSEAPRRESSESRYGFNADTPGSRELIRQGSKPSNSGNRRTAKDEIERR